MLYQINIPIQDQINAITTFPIQTDLGVFASSIVSVILTVASLITLFYLAWGGLNWIMAGGDKGKVEQARERITQAIIGLAIVASTWAVFLLLNYFFGLGMASGGGSGSGDSTGGSCSTSSAANCQGKSPGFACDSDRTCVALSSQPKGSDGKTKCTCK